MQGHVRSWGYSRLAGRATGLLTLTQLSHRQYLALHRERLLYPYPGSGNSRYDAFALSVGTAMQRRSFIGLLAGATVWPLSVRGQQAAVKIIGVLGFGSLQGTRASFAPAQRRLAEMGYVEGHNLAFEYRGADNQEDRLATLVGDLVQRRVSVIVAGGGPPIVAAKTATRFIPIVFFTGFDPVASGFVASLNRPGGNVTGITVLNTEVLAKRLELLRELVPMAKSIAFLHSSSNLVPGYDRIGKDMQSAADTLGVELLFVEAKPP